MIKGLNLYAGLGGNRKYWQGVEITAVEINPEIAKVYSDFFPSDKVVIADAHQYLLDHYQEFSFVWSSPPCPSHSQIRFNIGFKANRKYKKVAALYPNMALYQEIILLKHWFNGNWVVENTVPYYEPLIKGQITGGHIWWSNFLIPEIEHGNRNHRGGTVESLQVRKEINLDKYDIPNKRQLLRNCVEPEVGLAVFNAQFIKELKLL